MSSDHDLSPQPSAATTSADPAGLPAGAAVAAAVAALRQVDVSVRAAVAAVQGLDGGRVVVEEGMPVEAALRLHTGAAPADVAMLLSAAEVLAGMPVAAGLFARGVLSWGHVRALVAGAGRLDVATRAAGRRPARRGRRAPGACLPRPQRQRPRRRRGVRPAAGAVAGGPARGRAATAGRPRP